MHEFFKSSRGVFRGYRSFGRAMNAQRKKKKHPSIRYIYIGRDSYDQDQNYLGYNFYPCVFTDMAFVDKNVLEIAVFKQGHRRRIPLLTIIAKLKKYIHLRPLLRFINLWYLRMWGHATESILVAEVIYPGQIDYLRIINPDYAGYHLHDEYVSYEAHGKDAMYHEKDTWMKQLDYIHAVSPLLAEKAGKITSTVFMQPNGVGFEYFQKKESQVQREENTIVCLSALITSYYLRFIKETLEYNPKAKVVLIGNSSEEVRTALVCFEKIQRVEWKGFLSYDKIVREILAASVCLAIYPPSAFSKANSPLRVMMYFAAGKPAVATTFGTEILFPENSLYQSNEPKEFARLVSCALDECGREDLIKLRKGFAKSKSWPILVAQKLAFIRKLAETS